MALEAVVYQQDLFTHTTKDVYSLLEAANWSYDFAEQEKSVSFDNFLDTQTEHFLHASHHHSVFPHFTDMLQINPSPDANNANGLTLTANPPTEHHHHQQLLDSSSSMPARGKRRRSRSRKNKEEIENQRMTHIAVERNRRKQMNEYLSVLRSLMPESYVQRGDQASIIAGAINFVKELEQQLQLVGGQREVREKCDDSNSLPFSEFFTFPQYSMSSTQCENSVTGLNESMSSVTQSTIADIEVTMVDTHANLKIRLKRRPKQLLKVVSGLHTMRLTILHLNVTTIQQIVLYSISVKVEDDCTLSSVDEIATAVYQMLGRIQEECTMN